MGSPKEGGGIEKRRALGSTPGGNPKIEDGEEEKDTEET